jgi:hypothetical protein
VFTEGAMSVQSNDNDLRAELERVKKERDGYRATVRELLLKHYDFDLDEFESDLQELREKGGTPLSKMIADLKAEFGIMP